jgi:tetratricopeptide (TPR) repeat protein
LWTGLIVCTILLGFSSASVAQEPAQAPDSANGKPHEVVSQAAPDQPDWIARAIALEKQEDWPALLEWGQRWTKAEPGNAIGWFVVGRAFSELKRYPEAAAAYRQDLRIEPGDLYARNNLGDVYRENGLYLQAMEAYRDLVRINPDYIPAWRKLGLAFYSLKGTVGVVKALQELSTSDPELAAAWRKLAIEYSVTKDERVAQEAIKVLSSLSNAKRERMFEILFASV